MAKKHDTSRYSASPEDRLGEEERSRRLREFEVAAWRAISGWRAADEWTEAERLAFKLIGRLSMNMYHPMGPLMVPLLKQALAAFDDPTGSRDYVRKYWAADALEEARRGWHAGEDKPAVLEYLFRRLEGADEGFAQLRDAPVRVGAVLDEALAPDHALAKLIVDDCDAPIPFGFTIDESQPKAELKRVRANLSNAIAEALKNKR